MIWHVAGAMLVIAEGYGLAVVTRTKSSAAIVLNGRVLVLVGDGWRRILQDVWAASLEGGSLLEAVAVLVPPAPG